MDLTFEQARQMIEERFNEYPELGEIGHSEVFESTLSQILDFEGIDPNNLFWIAHEVRVVLALYTPISELASNIAESTKMPLEKAKRIALLIEALLLDPVLNELEQYDHEWRKEEAGMVPKKEEPTTQVQPLTRDELMRALERRQTAGGSLEAIRQKLGQAANPKTIGFDAVERKEDPNQ